ncbi:MAG: TraU family protein [Desulforegulaceae bacterium]|nr:TraU family protein [Desulforegulaceae bacterium]
MGKNNIQKKCFFFIFLFFLTWIPHAHDAHAICTPNPLNALLAVDWTAIFPIKIGGLQIGISPPGTSDPPSVLTQPICFCPNPLPRPGISFSMWEPVYIIETVKDPMCMMTLGVQLPIPFGNQAGYDKKTRHKFFNAHLIQYPVWSILGLLVDFMCVSGANEIDILDFSEVIPTWQNDQLATLLYPETLLFANPIAPMACIADAVSSNLGYPISPLFWCLGSAGTAYPMTGNINSEGSVQASMTAAGRWLNFLHRPGAVWDYATWACSPVPLPTWKKNHWRFQLIQPVPGRVQVMGRSALLWGAFKNPVGIADNFAWMVFRKRVCCAL